MRTAAPSSGGAAACDVTSLGTPAGITEFHDAVTKLSDFTLLHALLHLGAFANICCMHVCCANASQPYKEQALKRIMNRLGC